MVKILMLFLLCPFFMHAASGVGFGPGEIIYNNLQIGQEYDFGKLSNIPFEVWNKSTGSITVRIVKYAPSAADVKKDYEPVPDTDWITVTPEVFKDIPAGRKRTASLKIRIPQDKKYLGKKFQIFLQARTEAGPFMALGAVSRVLFTISGTVDKSVKKPEAAPAKFSVGPETVRIQDLLLGATNVSGCLFIRNESAKPIKFGMSIMNGKAAGRKLWMDYHEFPALSLVKPTKNYFVIRPGEKTDVCLKLFLETKNKYRNKKYQFFVNIHTVDEEIVEEYYLPVLVEQKSE